MSQFSEAVLLRQDVDEAIEAANESLKIAGQRVRLVSSWNLNGRGLAGDELVVYLVRSPAGAALVARRRASLQATVEAIRGDVGPINEGAESCDDTDECIERLYPESTMSMVLDVLNGQNRWELAKNSPQCHCVVLIESDLELFKAVFGADWNRFILLTRYDTLDDLQKAYQEGRVTDYMLNGQVMPLAAMVALLLLHEVGHVSDYKIDSGLIASPDIQAFINSMSSTKREEMRADAFVGRVLADRCLGKNPSGLSRELCFAPPALAMFTFAIGMKGKSKAARCLRYFDPIAGYPNWQARLLLMNLVYMSNSASVQGNFTDFISVRKALLADQAIQNDEGCKPSVEFSSR